MLFLRTANCRELHYPWLCFPTIVHQQLLKKKKFEQQLV